MRLAIILPVVFLLGCFYAEEKLLGQTAREQVVFEHLDLEDGLSQLSIPSIIQDRNGFIWIGTLDGLNRYDGYSFKVFLNNPDNKYSISNENIRSVIEDRYENAIWIGSKGGGVSKLDMATERFFNYLPDFSGSSGTNNNEEVFIIYQDLEGIIWIGTWGSGMNRFDPKTGKFIHFRHNPAEPHSLGNDIVRAIFEDRLGNLWVGTYGAGLYRMDRTNGHFYSYPLPASMNDGAGSLQIMCIYEPPSDPGILWIGTDGGGIQRFDPNKGYLEEFRIKPGVSSTIGHDRIRAILEDHNGVVWIATYGGGLSRFDYKTLSFQSFTHDPNDVGSISGDQLMSLWLDNNEILWIGAYSSGVNKLDMLKKKFYLRRCQPGSANTLSSSHIRSIYEDNQGILWVGTEDRGLNRIDRVRDTVVQYIHKPAEASSLGDNRVYGLLGDPDDNYLWLASFGSGIFRMDKKKGKFDHIPFGDGTPQFQDANRTRALARTPRGDMWIATWGGGLIRIDAKTKKHIFYKNDPLNPNSISHDQIFCLFTDRSGTLWAGAWGGGINVWQPDKDHFTHFSWKPSDSNSLNFNRILCIHEDNNGLIWVGTSGQGLNRFDRNQNQWKNYGKKEGLPNQVIYGILEDREANLWISTNRGLCRFNPAKGIFRNFTSMDGLQSNEFNGGAWHRNREGELFFGGMNGFNYFFPHEIRDNPYPPRVILTGFKKFNQPVDFGRAILDMPEIRLSHRDNFISFEFTALNFRSSKENRFRYKMEGFDSEWIDNGNRTSASYTNLGGGEYEFKVIAANNDGVWNNEGASIRLVVTPPWWTRWWFFGLGGIFLLFFTYLVYMARTNHIRLRNRQLSEVNNRLLRQIEERRKIEDALRASEEKFRSIFENIIDVFYRADLAGKLLMISPSGVALLGYHSDSEMIGASIGDTFYANPNDRNLFNEELFRQGLVIHFQVILKKKDGSLIAVESNARLVHDGDGQPVLVEGVFRDVTLRKQAEEEYRRLQEQLMHARRIEAVGNLAGGMAHEFNNLISVILGNANFIMFYAEESRNEVLTRRIQAVLRASNRCAELTGQLLSFSRKQMLRLEKINLNEMVSKNQHLIKKTAGEEIEVILKLSAELEDIEGDREMLTQSVLSLVDNAVEAMPGGGRLLIETGMMAIQTENAINIENTVVPENPEHVFISITDSGKGMTDEVRQHIFEPFFTTKETGQGSGLSLAFVYGTVRQHNGWINVRTAEGEGSAFILYLPIHAGETESVEQSG